MSKRKHDRRPVRNLLQQSFPDPHSSAPIPRRVQNDFERWIDAQKHRDLPEIKRLGEQIKRAGFIARMVMGNGDRRTYVLSRAPSPY